MGRGPLWQQYVDAFCASSRSNMTEAHAWIDEPGVLGFFGSEEKRDGSLLITGDEALPVLLRVGDPRARVIKVVAQAARCVKHVRGLDGLAAEPATGMIATRLDALPDGALPAGLVLRRARIGASGDDVELRDAAAACLRFYPPDHELAADDFAAYLAAVPGANLLAAVDAEGSVRATAGSVTFGDNARVFFVSTDPALRGRGVGTAMTAAALRAARDAGATQACLEASPAGRGIYERLGFEAVEDVVLFSHLT